VILTEATDVNSTHKTHCQKNLTRLQRHQFFIATTTALSEKTDDVFVENVDDIHRSRRLTMNDRENPDE